MSHLVATNRHGSLPLAIMCDVRKLAVVRRLLAEGTARQIRVAARLSLSEVARQLDVEPGTVSRWETGNRVPRIGVAVRYADLLTDLCDATREGDS